MNTGETARYELFPFVKNSMVEYLFTLQPDDASVQILAGQRKHLQEVYGGGVLQAGPLNIPLVQFVGSEQMEERILRWVQRLCANESSFLLTGSVLYAASIESVLLSVVKDAGWHRFVQRLRVIDDFMAAENCPPMEEVAHPYLALAEKLPAGSTGFDINACNAFTGNIPVVINGLILWNRAHAFSTWKRVNVFPLSPV